MRELSVPEAGVRLVVFGPNGAGKTTLLRRLAGIGETGERPGVAYLPQRPYMFRGTGRHNLHLGLAASERSTADALAGELGVAGVLGRPARQLSGGEVQRLALARVLASEQPVVLLDEPLAALDVKDRQHTAEVIARAVAERASVVVTHDRATVATLADTVAVMIDGEIRQRGPVEEVFSLPSDDLVAAAVGIGNALAGVVTQHDGPLVAVSVGGVQMWALGDHDRGSDVRLLFGAEAVTVFTGGQSGSSARNRWHGTVDTLRPVGRLVEVLVDIGVEVAALLTPGSIDALELAVGSEVDLSVKATAIRAVRRS